MNSISDWLFVLFFLAPAGTLVWVMVVSVIYALIKLARDEL